MGVFLLGTFGPAIKLTAIRGVPWIKAWGMMFLLHWLVFECMAFARKTAVSSDGFPGRRARCLRLLRLLAWSRTLPLSKVLIKICCVAFSCGAMIADTKALTLAGLEKEEGRKE